MCRFSGFVLFSEDIELISSIKKIKIMMNQLDPDNLNIVSVSNSVRGTYKTNNENDLSINDRIILINSGLSMFDQSKNAAQPMCSNDLQLIITCNGEVYNFLELRDQLISTGHQFQTESDTEVILAAYKQYGLDCLPRFNGMFAFGLVDNNNRQILLATDPFNKKPLFFVLTEKLFAFASEPKFLLPLLPRVKANNYRIYQYLIHGQIIFGDETCFSQIHRLEPCEYMIFNLEKKQIEAKSKYITFRSDNKIDCSFNEAKLKVREIITKNVMLQCRSTFPVATFLSGGLDSSAIVSSIVKQNLNPTLQTFSYFSHKDRLNEAQWVDKMVKHHNISNYAIQIDNINVSEDIDNLIFIQDEPFGGLSALAQYKLFEKAREYNTKVTLDGLGADIVFAGEMMSIATRIVELLKSKQFSQAFFLTNTLINNNQQYLTTILRHAAFLLLPINLRTGYLNAFGKIPTYSFIKKGHHNNNDFRSKLQNLNSDYLAHTNYLSLKDQLLKDQESTGILSRALRYADRNSKAFSIECRVPFLTFELISFTHSLPNEYLVNAQGTTKYVLREAMRGIVPDEIIDRKDKLGFEAPDEHIIRNNLVYFDFWMQPEQISKIPFLDATQIIEMWNSFKNYKSKYNGRIWRLINTIIWAHRFNVEFE